MQARLELIKSPAMFFVVVFALASALCLGAVLGYTLKPSVLVGGSPQVVVVHETGVTPPPTGCIYVDNHKAC